MAPPPVAAASPAEWRCCCLLSTSLPWSELSLILVASSSNYMKKEHCPSLSFFFGGGGGRWCICREESFEKGLGLGLNHWRDNARTYIRVGFSKIQTPNWNRTNFFGLKNFQTETKLTIAITILNWIEVIGSVQVCSLASYLHSPTAISLSSVIDHQDFTGHVVGFSLLHSYMVLEYEDIWVDWPAFALKKKNIRTFKESFLITMKLACDTPRHIRWNVLSFILNDLLCVWILVLQRKVHTCMPCELRLETDSCLLRVQASIHWSTCCIKKEKIHILSWRPSWVCQIFHNLARHFLLNRRSTTCPLYYHSSLLVQLMYNV